MRSPWCGLPDVTTSGRPRDPSSAGQGARSTRRLSSLNGASRTWTRTRPGSPKQLRGTLMRVLSRPGRTRARSPTQLAMGAEWKWPQPRRRPQLGLLVGLVGQLQEELGTFVALAGVVGDPDLAWTVAEGQVLVADHDNDPLLVLDVDRDDVRRVGGVTPADRRRSPKRLRRVPGRRRSAPRRRGAGRQSGRIGWAITPPPCSEVPDKSRFAVNQPRLRTARCGGAPAWTAQPRTRRTMTATT